MPDLARPDTLAQPPIIWGNAATVPDQKTPMQQTLAMLQDGATVVTRTRRHARILRRQYDRWQAKRGRAWTAGAVWQWSDWLGRLWLMASTHAPDACKKAGMLLNRVQERALWEQVIRDTPEGRELLQVGDVADTARTAWRALNAWQIPMEAPGWRLNGDARAFTSWSKHYTSACAGGGFLDPARLPAALVRQIRKRCFPLPSSVLLAGFDDLDKQQRQLVESLHASGCAIRQISPSSQGKHARRAAFADAYEEVSAAARWIRQWLQRHPDHSIGVAVAGLDGYRSLIRSRFHEILDPGAMLSDAFGEAVCFDMPAGRSLLDYPLVQTALQVLALLDEGPTLEALGSLLRSPHLAGAEREMTRRALLDARLRAEGKQTGILELFRYLAGAPGPREHDQVWRCPVLGQALERLQQQAAHLPPRQSAAAWAGSYSRLLSNMGWPGERGLSSAEYQTAQAWDELLQALASLSCVTPALSYGEALNQLRRAALERVYQPEDPEAPVRVMDISETMGLCFDGLWILGLHDGRWPPAAEPLPFIPLPLQYQIPQASTERSLALAQAATEDLIGCAPAVMLSYPQCEGEISLAPSPLITSIPLLEDAPEQAPEEYSRHIQRCARLEPYDDAIVPPLSGCTRAQGGAGVIREQALCPFRAFATYRLGARPLRETMLGLDPAQRGKLTHSALERLWIALGDQAALLCMSEAELDRVIRQAVERALSDEPLAKRFAALEGERLTALLRDWLQVERDRAPFEVLAVEAEREFTIGGLRLRLRIDRIDRLSDGRLGVIDYKTGEAGIKAWFEDRPEEPQLPLYALALGEDCAMVAFAKLKRGACTYDGLGAAQAGLPVLRETKWGREYRSWEALVNAWRVRIETLAREFRSSEARVAPKDPVETCRSCSLHTLCRIADLGAARRGMLDE